MDDQPTTPDLAKTIEETIETLPDLAKTIEETIETLLHRAADGHNTGADSLAYAQAAAVLLSTQLGEVVTVR